MKDSIRSLKVSNAVMYASAILVIASLAILGGIFISSDSALAEESPEKTRIVADINESYFTTEGNARLAQGGSMNTRSQEESSETATDEESDDDFGQCENLYLEDHLRIDFDNNDQEEVLRLQSFLKTYEGYDYVSLSGVFDEDTLRAVKAFQTRYADDVLTPWGYQADEATGYVYITTKQKINEIYCDEQFLLSRQQQAEIREYREKLNQWRAQGASFETPQYLANYYGYTWSEATESTLVAGDIDRQELEPRESEGGVTVTETSDDTAATSATSTEEDGRNFFQRLFGIGDDEATTTATTTSTTTDDEEVQDDEDDTVVDDTDETATSATGTATTSGIDNVAAGVYNGVNGIIDFLLSPTFLLVVLVVLILLLIATLIESDDEDEEEGDTDSQKEGDDDETTESEVEEEVAGEAWEEYAEAEVVDDSTETEEEAEDEDKKN